MKILVSNDDGYTAKGIHALVKALLPFGEITVVAPKTHQSGMSMAVSLGRRPIAVKDLGTDGDGVHWIYVDGTPASATKFAVDMVFKDSLPDLVVSGINHGLNSSTSSWYSGTLGAARECALAGIKAVAVSLDNMSSDADFTVVKELFPTVLTNLMAMGLRDGVIYNVNFPDIPSSEIKGIKSCTLGLEKWVEEFVPWDEAYPHPQPEEGEVVYMMAGDVQPDPRNDETSDNWAVEHGFIAVTPHTMDNTDLSEYRRLQKLCL